MKLILSGCFIILAKIDARQYTQREKSIKPKTSSLKILIKDDGKIDIITESKKS